MSSPKKVLPFMPVISKVPPSRAIIEARMEKAFRSKAARVIEIGKGFWIIYYYKMFKPDYPSFAAYSQKRWNICSATAYAWRRAAEVFNYLKKTNPVTRKMTDDAALKSKLLPANESQLLKLARLLGADDNQARFDPVRHVWSVVLSRVRAGTMLTTALIDHEGMVWRMRANKMPMSRDKRLQFVREMNIWRENVMKSRDPILRSTAVDFSRIIRKASA